jgi:hypothetical protein
MQFLSGQLRAILNSVDYQYMSKNLFRKNSSTKIVEHYLFFEVWGRPKNFLQFDFGVRNENAEKFARHCQIKYGNPLFREFREADLEACSMRFPVEAFYDSNSLGYIDYAAVGPVKLNEYVKELVVLNLFPVIEKIATIATLFEFLISDPPYAPWFRIDGVLRIAQVAYLAKECGYNSTRCEKLLNEVYKKASLSVANEPMEKEYFLQGILFELFVAQNES